MNESDKRRFFAMKKEKPTTVKVGGKLSVNKLPSSVISLVKKRLAQKDEVMARGLKGELPGLKIDGKQVTRDNIHEFEISNKNKTNKKVSEKKGDKKSMTKEDLEKIDFLELKEIAKKYGETGRSKKGIIRDILKHIK